MNFTENGYRKNPDWQRFKDRSFRMPNQFGSQFLTDLEMTQRFPEVFGAHNEQDNVVQYTQERSTIALEDLQPDEADQLLRRGAVFPLEIAEGIKYNPLEVKVFEREPHI